MYDKFQGSLGNRQIVALRIEPGFQSILSDCTTLYRAHASKQTFYYSADRGALAAQCIKLASCSQGAFMWCRGAYQRAMQVPCTGLDQLWRAYEVFEQQGSSRALARRVLEQQRPRYQAARTALGPRSRLQAALNPTALPFPPGDLQFHLLPTTSINLVLDQDPRVSVLLILSTSNTGTSVHL